jgi:hypothetical protein
MLGVIFTVVVGLIATFGVAWLLYRALDVFTKDN